MAKQVLIRLISSREHDMPRDNLVKLIRSSGSDRYDSERKQVFDDFYGKHNIDFFGTLVPEKNLEKELTRAIKELPQKTLGDRKYAIYPDIAIIYDPRKCTMIKNVYGWGESSDCYKFAGNPKDALIEVRSL